MKWVLFPRVRRALRQPVRNEPLYVMRWLPTAFVMLAVVVGGGAFALWFADTWAAARTHGMDPLNPETAALRLDAVKTALTVAAGLGAGVTLLLALRRQAINERAQRFAEEDAQEERITTLYVAAVEQLGSDKAAVRLGGLYALERLGDDHPRLRQTVFEVVCAYLRMPFTTPEADVDVELLQEQEVRLTAQRLLTTHLAAPEYTEPTTYWRGPDGQRMNVNLRGATLIRFDLTDAAAGDLDLTSAVLYGDASLDRLAVHGHATVRGAAFRGEAAFRDAHFHSTSWFDKITVGSRAVFSGARFDAIARFADAHFNSECDLRDTTFHGSVSFASAWFGQDALMDKILVHGALDLRSTKFQDVAVLRHARILDGLIIDDARFTGLTLARSEISGTIRLLRAKAKNLAPAEGWELTGDPDADGYRRLARTSGPRSEEGEPEMKITR